MSLVSQTLCLNTLLLFLANSDFKIAYMQFISMNDLTESLNLSFSITWIKFETGIYGYIESVFWSISPLNTHQSKNIVMCTLNLPSCTCISLNNLSYSCIWWVHDNFLLLQVKLSTKVETLLHLRPNPTRQDSVFLGLGKVPDAIYLPANRLSSHVASKLRVLVVCFPGS